MAQRSSQQRLPEFSLVLMLTHACNLRCAYCYGGTRRAGTLAPELGRRAIDRAAASVEPHGLLSVGFFGGEPLLAPELMDELAQHARRQAAQHDLRLRLAFTTNGTVDTPAAQRLMTSPDIHVSISHDGLPAVHDRHRRTADGRGTCAQVERTIGRLQRADKDVTAVMVIRPDTLRSAPEGLSHLLGLGMGDVVLSLDLWTSWAEVPPEDLSHAIGRLADLWGAHWPHADINWFNEKTARLLGRPLQTARCGFGRGEVAVAPSGRLYPCERLIGDDAGGHPLLLPGHAADGGSFLDLPEPDALDPGACAGCGTAALCGTDCRCSNYVRTGHVARPDRLLCLHDRFCTQHTRRVLQDLAGREAFAV
jgi:uncharacterized protein